MMTWSTNSGGEGSWTLQNPNHQAAVPEAQHGLWVPQVVISTWLFSVKKKKHFIGNWVPKDFMSCTLFITSGLEMMVGKEAPGSCLSWAY